MHKVCHKAVGTLTTSKATFAPGLQGCDNLWQFGHFISYQESSLKIWMGSWAKSSKQLDNMLFQKQH